MAISAKSARDLIRELNDTDETESLEAKALSGNQLGNSVFETICSLSNEPDLGGGTILLGVQKEEDSLFPLYRAAGVKDVDKIFNDVSTGCASRFNIPVRVDLEQEVVDGKVVIRIDVAELLHSQKPLYFKQMGLPRGAFRRIGSTDQHCTDDDLTAFFQTKAHDPYDGSIIEEASWDDMDDAAIESYRRARSEVNPLAEELNWSNVDVLHSLGCIKKVKEEIRITATGLVVFGKVAALRRIRPALRVDYVRVPGKEWVPDVDHRFDSVDMRGPLMTLVGRVITTVLDDIPKAFRVEEGNSQRTDMPIIPARVIREAVVNSLMHRNYQFNQPVQIIRYSNRIEIRNPGYSLKSQDRFDDPGSAIRNPHISEILHETRYAETKGSGIRVMREKMSQMGLSEPTFISNRDSDEFHAVFLFHHFLNESDWHWLSLFKSYQLNEEQMRALIFVREMGAIDNSSFRHVVKLDTLAASMHLRKLKEHGLLVSKGSGSRTYYEPGKRYHEAIATQEDPVNGHDSMHANLTGMHAKEGTPLFREIMSRFPSELQMKIFLLSKRIEPSAAERLILDMCKARPMSADEIAMVLRRTKQYVSNKYLYKMVKAGKLHYVFPGMVKHPAQRYIIAPSAEEED